MPQQHNAPKLWLDEDRRFRARAAAYVWRAIGTPRHEPHYEKGRLCVFHTNTPANPRRGGMH